MIELIRQVLSWILLRVMATVALIWLSIFAFFCWIFEEPEKELTREEYYGYE